MKIYFGKAPTQELNGFGTDGLMEHDGEFYSGCVEFGSNPGGIEDVVISDGCGRGIPLSVDTLLEVCAALCECINIGREISAAEELKEYVESSKNIAAVREFGHIHY